MPNNFKGKICHQSILISTRLPQHPKEKDSLLFLGGWCKSKTQKVSGQAYLDANICAPFGFNKKEFQKGENAFEKIYEEVLTAVVNALNKYHTRDYDVRYWEIFCGSWIYRFVGLLLNRYFQLEKATNEHPNLKYHYCVDDNDFTLASSCEIESVKRSSDDRWNSVLYRILVQKYFPRIENIPYKYEWDEHTTTKRIKIRQIVKKTLPLLSSGGKLDDLFVYKSYLPPVSDLMLKRSLNVRTNIWQTYRTKTLSLVDKEGRQALFNQDGQTDLAIMVLTMMRFCLPRAFLEDYETNVELTKKVNWPRRPKIIYTVNGFAGDPVFQLFVAEKVRQFGTNYVVGQHGANYGTLRMSRFWPEMRVASKFISWGWSNEARYNIEIKPGFNLIDRKIGSCFKKRVLIVLKGPGNRSAISCRHFEYMLEVNMAIAIADLFGKFQEWEVTVRLHHNASEDEANFIKQKCEENEQTIKMDNGLKAIERVSKDHGLIIFTYDSAGFLECLSSNRPTIGAFKYFKGRYFENAQKKYSNLRDAGIINGDINTLAIFLEKHHDNINDWWNTQSNQSVVKDFTSEYVKQKPKNKRLADLLNPIFWPKS